MVLLDLVASILLTRTTSSMPCWKQLGQSNNRFESEMTVEGVRYGYGYELGR